jgi:hypothetical protein
MWKQRGKPKSHGMQAEPPAKIALIRSQGIFIQLDLTAL